MRSVIKDILFAVLVVTVVLVVRHYAFPPIDTGTIEVSLVPLATSEPDGPPSVYVAEIEGIAVGVYEQALAMGAVPEDGATVLVLNFFHTWCDQCMREFEELKVLALERPDVMIIALTTETDQVAIDEMMTEMELGFLVLYGLPGEVLSSWPNTHVLTLEDGRWDLSPDGTWIGFVGKDTILEYIGEKERTNHEA